MFVRKCQPYTYTPYYTSPICELLAKKHKNFIEHTRSWEKK